MTWIVKPDLVKDVLALGCGAGDDLQRFLPTQAIPMAVIYKSLIYLDSLLLDIKNENRNTPTNNPEFVSSALTLSLSEKSGNSKHFFFQGKINL